MCCFRFLVEVTGLEPTTFWSLTRRATKLRYTSICIKLFKHYLLYLKYRKKQTVLCHFLKKFKTKNIIIILPKKRAYDIMWL